MIKITSQQNILLLAMIIIRKKKSLRIQNVKNLFLKTYFNFIGTIRVIFDRYNVMSLVPGHSKNYIAADKLSFNVAFL